MRETRLSGSEGGGDEPNRLSLPLSPRCRAQLVALFLTSPVAFGRAAVVRIVPSSRIALPGISECPLDEGRRSADVDRALGTPVVLHDRHGRVRARSPQPPSSSTSCSTVRKICGPPEKRVKTYRSPGSGRSASGSVEREKVKTKSDAPGRATRAASSTAARNCAVVRARFQMPCATMKSMLPPAIGRCSIGASTRPSLCPGASVVSRCRAAWSMPSDRSVAGNGPALKHERNGVASGAAADVQQLPRAAGAPGGGHIHQRLIGRRLREAADVAASLHGVPDNGSFIPALTC